MADKTARYAAEFRRQMVAPARTGRRTASPSVEGLWRRASPARTLAQILKFSRGQTATFSAVLDRSPFSAGP